MTITREVRAEFLDEESKSLICLPCRTSARSIAETANAAASASAHNRRAAVVPRPMLLPHASSEARAVMSMVPLQPPVATNDRQCRSAPTKGQRWSEDEHERFLLGLDMFPAGPWKKIARVVGTRDPRQTMSHAQKYRQKIKRRKLGLRTLSASTGVDQSWQHGVAADAQTPATSVEPSGDEANTQPHLSVAVSAVEMPSSHASYPRLAVQTGPKPPVALLAEPNPAVARTLSGAVASAAQRTRLSTVDDTAFRLELRQTPDAEPPLLAPPDNWSPLTLLDVWALPNEET